MKTKAFKDLQLSCLGMGNMRLPLNGPKDTDIDMEKAQAIIDYAMAHGINYYDTAYVYHNGESERFLGKAMAKYPRESFCLATKFNYNANPDYKAVFEEQLERLNTDYIDFYLLHAIGDGTADKYIDCGCIEYFEEQKKLGRIRYLGFSAHASVETLERVASLREWDFAQIQLNYFDWNFSTAKAEYEVLTSHNIPVIVMEPVRGGKLANLTDECNAELKAEQPDWSIASWAFRWLQRLDNVQVVLSGMTTMDQMVDNVATFSEGEALTDAQEEKLFEVVQNFRSQVVIPCTGCRYCTEDCPMGIDIPKMMNIYNGFKVDGPWALAGLKDVEEGHTPADCIGCGACTGHCPQNIQIPEVMQQLAEAAAKFKR